MTVFSNGQVRADKRGTVLRLFCFAVLLAFGTGAPLYACELPRDLMSLARTLSVLSNQPGPIAGWQAERLANDLSSLSEKDVLRDMDDSGLDGAISAAIDLMSAAHRIRDSGQLRSPDRIRALLTELDATAQQNCANSAGALFQKAQQESFGAAYSDGRIDWQELNRRLQQDKALSFAVLLGAMSSLIIALFVLESLFRWVMALIYNRKACRIGAVLIVGSEQVQGQIVTLGKGGCRFHPDNQAQFNAVLPNLRGSVSELRAEAEVLPVRISAIFDEQCDFLFERHMTVNAQRALLRHSTISPHYIKKTRNGGRVQTGKTV